MSRTIGNSSRKTLLLFPSFTLAKSFPRQTSAMGVTGWKMESVGSGRKPQHRSGISDVDKFNLKSTYSKLFIPFDTILFLRCLIKNSQKSQKIKEYRQISTFCISDLKR